MVPEIDSLSGNLEMTNLRTEEMAFSRNSTKIGTDENKSIYSKSYYCILLQRKIQKPCYQNVLSKDW